MPEAARKERAHTNAVFPKDRQVLVSDGTRIAYTIRGEGGPGVPVLFVNGWTCTDAYWSSIAPALIEAGHPAMFLDARGHGESGLPRPPGLAARQLRPTDLDPGRLARDIVEVMDDARIDRAALVGHSMGVQVIVETCVIASDRVAALVPIAGTFENPVKTFADLGFLDRLYPVAEALFRVTPFEFLRPIVRRTAQPAVGHRVARLIRVAGPKVRPEHLASHMVHLGDANFSVLFKMMSEMRRHNTVDELPRISVPVLVLAGRRDLFTPPTVQQKMAELIPGAEIVWFEDGGHLLPVEEPEAISGAILDFLRRRLG
jgi:pimeloyl-ACP methyl ester carboxylesterase